MDNIHMYVVLGAPPRSEVAIVHHQEITPDEHDELRAGYDTGALDDAVIVAHGWLHRILDAQDGEDAPESDGDVPSQGEQSALHVLLGCLAAEAYEPIHAGHRWALIDVRYHREDARVKVMWWTSRPAFTLLSQQVGHA